MITVLLTALEAIWAANTFNQLSEMKIDLSFTEDEVKRIAQANDIDFKQLVNTVLYENITVKEQAISSVEQVFSGPADNEAILKKRRTIEAELKTCEELLKFPQTA